MRGPPAVEDGGFNGWRCQGNPVPETERSIGLLGATSIGVGAIVGGGVLALAGVAFAATGPGAVLAFALNGLIALLTALKEIPNFGEKTLQTVYDALEKVGFYRRSRRAEEEKQGQRDYALLDE